MQSGEGFDMSSTPEGKTLQKGVGRFGTSLMKAFSTPTTSTNPANSEMGSASGAINAVNTTPDMTSNPASQDVAGARGGLANKGGHVKAKKPSQKAEKKGNSYDNDKIPAYLSEGEVVIPRSVMQGKDPIRGSADFVAKIMAKRGRK